MRDVLIEIASNPELRPLIAPHVPVPAATPPVESLPEPKKPSIWGRIKAQVAEAKKAAAGAVTRAKEAVIRRCAIAGEAVVALGRMTGESLPVRKIVLVGLGVGLVVGIACLVVPQTTAAVIGGAGAACTSIAAQTGSWLTRAARRVGLLS